MKNTTNKPLKPAVLKFQDRMKNRLTGDDSGSSCDAGCGCYTLDDVIRGITESGDYLPTEEDNRPNTKGVVAKGMPPAPTRLHRRIQDIMFGQVRQRQISRN
jgi:hypothetical protein